MTTHALEKSCNGERCINGYARMMNYWEETKSSESTFPLVENQLRVGIINAHKLRRESDIFESAPIYERNPYTNVDRLVCRLIKTEVFDAGTTCLYTDAGDRLDIWVDKNIIVILNKSDRTTIIKSGLLKKYNSKTKKITNLNERLLLKPQEHTFCVLNFNDLDVVLIEKTTTHPEYIFLPD